MINEGIVFQNYHHVNIDKIIEEWKKPGILPDKVIITFIKSPMETGYFGRFISPLTSSVTNNAYFIVCDDDIIWGDRYFENMLRVVDEGFLATRNGRIIQIDYSTTGPTQKNLIYYLYSKFVMEIRYIKRVIKYVLTKILNMTLEDIFGQDVYLGFEMLGRIFQYL